MAIRDYSQTPSLNTSLSGISLAEGVMTHASINDSFRQAMADIRELQARASIASAGTMAIGAANAESLDVTGTTTITAFDNVAAGVERELVFSGSLTLTHNATSLILPGGTSITTAAGDVAKVRSLGSGNWRCVSYARASGLPVVETSNPTAASVAEMKTGVDASKFATAAGVAAVANGPWADLASAGTTDLGAAAVGNLRITGTTTITSFGTIDSGVTRRLRFAGALTLTHNATSLILPGAANITTVANDSCEAVSLGSGNWFVTRYTRAAQSVDTTYTLTSPASSGKTLVMSASPTSRDFRLRKIVLSKAVVNGGSTNNKVTDVDLASAEGADTLTITYTVYKNDDLGGMGMSMGGVGVGS